MMKYNRQRALTRSLCSHAKASVILTHRVQHALRTRSGEGHNLVYTPNPVLRPFCSKITMLRTYISDNIICPYPFVPTPVCSETPMFWHCYAPTAGA